MLYVTKGDSAFYPGLRALARSLRRFDDSADIVVFDCGLTDDQVVDLRAQGCEVQHLCLAHTSRPQTVEGTHYNDAIYALMHIRDLDTDRFVHLDADVIVLPAFAEFVALLEKVDFVGVSDHPTLTIGENIGPDSEQRFAASILRFRRSLDSEAVNAGVFGARMSTFRDLHDVMQIAYESALELPRRDQTLLNIAIAVHDPSSAQLDVRFNFRHHFRRRPDFGFSRVEKVDGILQPYCDGPIGVMHYIGPAKPWMPGFDRTSDAFRIWEQFSA